MEARLVKAEGIYVSGVLLQVDDQLQLLASDLFSRAQKRQDSLLVIAGKLAEFGPIMQEQGGGFIAGWCQDPACEQELKKFSGFTRCLLETHRVSTCFHCGKSSVQDVLVAKSY